jgi:hypothetical protein
MFEKPRGYYSNLISDAIERCKEIKRFTQKKTGIVEAWGIEWAVEWSMVDNAPFVMSVKLPGSKVELIGSLTDSLCDAIEVEIQGRAL